MRARRATAILGVIGFCVTLGCGEDDKQSAKPAPTSESPDGGVCASDAECPAERPKCWPTGACVSADYCDLDTDCLDPARRFCNAAHACVLCVTNAHCPAAAPVCAPAWEGGVACAECRGGDSSTCERGKWCTAVSEGAGGTCLPPDCPTSVSTEACSACASENASDCLNADVCIEALGTLRDCYSAEIPGWTSEDCPTGVVPAMRGCTPEACASQAAAFDTCILRCGVVRQRCFDTFTGD